MAVLIKRDIVFSGMRERSTDASLVSNCGLNETMYWLTLHKPSITALHHSIPSLVLCKTFWLRVSELRPIYDLLC